MIFIMVNKTKIGMARCLYMTNYRTWFRYTCMWRLLCVVYCWYYQSASNDGHLFSTLPSITTIELVAGYYSRIIAEVNCHMTQNRFSS